MIRNHPIKSNIWYSFISNNFLLHFFNDNQKFNICYVHRVNTICSSLPVHQRLIKTSINMMSMRSYRPKNLIAINSYQTKKTKHSTWTQHIFDSRSAWRWSPSRNVKSELWDFTFTHSYLVNGFKMSIVNINSFRVFSSLRKAYQTFALQRNNSSSSVSMAQRLANKVAVVTASTDG